MSLFTETILKTYGNEGEKWLQQLPTLLEKYLRKWQLTLDGSFQNLRFNYVVPVVCQNGSLGVLKLGPHLKSLRREWSSLKLFSEFGAVSVLNYCEEDGALLVRRVSPGETLKSLLENKIISESDSLKIACDIFKKLSKVSISEQQKSQLTPVTTWGLGFEKFLREDCRGVAFPKDQVIKADQIFKDLVRSTQYATALHGDLHHENILSSDRADLWTVIDPKGVFGDVAFEVGAFIRNPLLMILTSDQPEELLFKRIQFLSLGLNLPKDRVWGWAYSQCVLAAIWTVEDSHENWEDWLIVARSLEKIQPLC